MKKLFLTLIGLIGFSCNDPKPQPQKKRDVIEIKSEHYRITNTNPYGWDISVHTDFEIETIGELYWELAYAKGVDNHAILRYGASLSKADMFDTKEVMLNIQKVLDKNLKNKLNE